MEKDTTKNDAPRDADTEKKNNGRSPELQARLDSITKSMVDGLNRAKRNGEDIY